MLLLEYGDYFLWFLFSVPLARQYLLRNCSITIAEEWSCRSFGKGSCYNMLVSSWSVRKDRSGASEGCFLEGKASN